MATFVRKRKHLTLTGKVVFKTFHSMLFAELNNDKALKT